MNNPQISNLGTKRWFNEKGELHREDGPAIEWYHGVILWYYHGEMVCCETQEEFERLIKLRVFW